MNSPAEFRALAARFQRFGALGHAEALYRKALETEPANAGLWADLGRIKHSLGRHDEAVADFCRALDLEPSRLELRNDLGVSLMDLGRLDEAVASFREALRLQPDRAEVHANLGIARTRQGDPHAAAACYRQALLLNADEPVVTCHLGNALVALGERDGAVACYRRAVQVRPDFAAAWLNLGRVLQAQDQQDEAAACYERAATLWPDNPEPLGELASLMMSRGELDAAVAGYEEVLRLQPDSAAAYSNMGLAQMALGRLEEARLSFGQALYLRPDLAEVHNNLGLALLNEGRLEEARLRFERAIAAGANLADAQNNLGLAWNALGAPDSALASFERAVQIDPRHFGALTNLANTYRDHGRAADAVIFYRKALAVAPDAALVHSNLLLAMQYRFSADPTEMLAEARRYARMHAEPLTTRAEPHATLSLEGRRLRVGYVSPDFREHPVASFLEPVLACHDHVHIEVFCYADVPQPDATTLRLQAYSDRWRSLVGLTDAQAAAVIRQDELDVLVDLSGHTGGNRLLTFAHKPAPIQVSYLGYLGTTGLPAMDYYLTDAHADPPGGADAHYQERLIRLPECAFCYGPGDAPDVRREPPARESGQVTFGCLNNLAKGSDEALAAWSRLLALVPDSRLLLRTGAGRPAEERIRALVARHGISTERLLFAGPTPTRFAYLELYHALDIALDPFPYNGVTTTTDALWMGVPVISLIGQTSVSRQGVRFLRNAGLDELLAETLEQYLQIAANLAGNVSRLAALRSALRDRMKCSPLMDAQRLTRNLEAAFRDICQKSLRAHGPINP
jgi:predicted O-linked N-acetylglucosamine transferase (SPINDLY family)